MKKLLCLVMIIMTVLAVHVSAYADTALSFETQQNLGSVNVNEEIEPIEIRATGGHGAYTYEMVNERYFPPGLRTLETVWDEESQKYVGVISGKPTSGGVTYCNMKVRVTDEDGCTAEKAFRLTIVAKKVNFDILKNTFFYNGSLQSVAGYATPTVNGALVEGLDVTYSEYENVGNYSLKIKVNTPGYVFGSANETRMYINQNPYTKVTFGEKRSFEYNAKRQSPGVTVTKQLTADSAEELMSSNSYTLSYVGINGTSYSSSEPPIMPGNYRVSCNITDTNFATPSANSTTFEITANTVNFTLDNMAPFYYGDTWNRAYKPSVSSVTGYTVKYVKDGVEYDAPSALGDYSVKITFDEDSLYTVGEISPATVTVEPRPVDFRITGNPQLYADGASLYPTISNDYGLTEENNDYTVTYYKEEDENKTSPVTPAEEGRYIIDIKVNNPNYTYGSQTADIFTIYTETEPAKITLGEGNSIVVRMKNDLKIDIEAAKLKFDDDGHRYNGKDYSENAWIGDNLDEDEYALFMYYGEEVTLPEVSATGYGGGDADVKTVIKKGDTVVATLAVGATTYTPNLDCGVYTIEYSIVGDTSEYPVTATRNVVILWPLGDVNYDKNVNSIDGNYIMGNLNMSETTADEKLFKYRMCDIDKNGIVNSGDRDALYMRLVNPIVEYYK